MLTPEEALDELLAQVDDLPDAELVMTYEGKKLVMTDVRYQNETIQVTLEDA